MATTDQALSTEPQSMDDPAKQHCDLTAVSPGNAANAAPRSTALDILRGLAIVTMVFSGTVPFKVLPAWMYHAQLPPPTHKFSPDLPGLSWVDLVFPFFLFSLGAALPLALGRKLSTPNGWRVALMDGFRRFGLILFFAVATWHLNPIRLNGWKPELGWISWASGLLSCDAFTLVLARLSPRWPVWLTASIRVAGWLLAAGLVYFLPVLHGKEFSLKRSDIILVVLSNVALFGTLVMVAFRAAPSWRWSILFLGLALHAGRQMPGDNFVKDLTNLKHLEWTLGSWAVESIVWAFHPRYLKYLFIVIPGIAAGDILVRYLAAMRQENDGLGSLMQQNRRHWLGGIGLLSLALCITGLFLGFHQSRWVASAALSCAAGGGIGYFVWRTLPLSAARNAVGDMLVLSAVAIALGFCLEPYQGGAKKDFATLSYYAFGSGFAALNLAGFLAWEAFGRLGPVSRLLAANGQNPMLAYIASAFLVQPFFHVTGLWKPLVALTPQPWAGAGRALLITVLGALVVAGLGRLKIVWRS